MSDRAQIEGPHGSGSGGVASLTPDPPLTHAVGAPPAQVRAGKNTLIYNVHSYSTKVPYQAIAPFISLFTSPGERVLDPFCGSGMTGVAAILMGRHATLADIAPAAIHIATNYLTPCDARALADEARRITGEAEFEVLPLYQTICDRCHGPATVEYTVWSDVFACAHCAAEISYWDSAVDREAGSVRPFLRCPRCGRESKKTGLLWRRSIPVSTKYSCRGGCKRLVERAVTDAETALSRRVESELVADWHPTDAFGPEREMWRKSHDVMGIRSVDCFYTRRNLRALAVLWRHIQTVSDSRLRSALRFAFTASVNRASRRYQWNAKRPTNVQTGTLYIASLNYEWNILSLFRRKLRDVLAYYLAYPSFPGRAEIMRDSAASLSAIAPESVDYIFTDPPFGANIYYADCALLWESWLGEYTDPGEEILIHRKRRDRGGNSLTDYQRLMTRAFVRMHEVLKPGRSASVVFHSSQPEVWRSIQEAVRDAGFELISTTALDKGQPSIKGLKGQRGEEHVAAVDVILNLRKPGALRFSRPGPTPSIEIMPLVLEALRVHLLTLPSRIATDPSAFSNQMRRTQHLHTLAVRLLLERGVPFEEISFAFIDRLCREHFALRGEYWYGPDEPPLESDMSPQLELLPHALR